MRDHTTLTLGRSIERSSRALRVSDAHTLGPAHTTQSRKPVAAEMKEVGRAMRNVFEVSEDDVLSVAPHSSGLRRCTRTTELRKDTGMSSVGGISSTSQPADIYCGCPWIT
jgi:hypothetical protein